MNCLLCGTRLPESVPPSNRDRPHLLVMVAPTCRVCGVLAGVADFRRVRTRVEQLSRFGLGGEHRPLLSDTPDPPESP